MATLVTRAYGMTVLMFDRQRTGRKVDLVCCLQRVSLLLRNPKLG